MGADQFGIDPETMEPMPMPEGDGSMPPELMEMLGQDPGVDPGAGPADPMLGPVDEGDEDEYDEDEFEERNKVELCLLGAIESCAKAVEVGVGSDNHQFAQAYGQAAASLAQAFEALMRTEQADMKAAQQPVNTFI